MGSFIQNCKDRKASTESESEPQFPGVHVERNGILVFRKFLVNLCARM